ncbi:MAG: hypothetical protein GX282_03660 [Campylobacteraceae bacterium]|nr:hypothetical protein [Campylobacteraceae bacterium]
MNKKYLEEEANSIRVQKHQLDNAFKKTAELNSALNERISRQKRMLSKMQNLVDSFKDENSDIKSTDTKEEKFLLVAEIKTIDTIEQIDFRDDMSWSEYLESVEKYAIKHNIDLTDDPFRNLMSNSQLLELQKRIKEDFTYKNAKCDKYDYMIAGTCGVIGGIIDVLFVGKATASGKPSESILGSFIDEKTFVFVEKIAFLLGFDKKAIEEKYKNYVKKKIAKREEYLDFKSYYRKNLIQFLEKKFIINYDQASTNGNKGTGGKVEDLSTTNHRLKSLGHSPDLIGLFFSIYNQFTSTSSFVSNGKIITIDTETFELRGNNFVAKIFCGFCNWIGHIISDLAGSNSTIEKGNRGSGIPIPFYELLLLLKFGKFKHKPKKGKPKNPYYSFAEICTIVFQEGYDFRHGVTMSIPILITELLIRVMYVVKARFYHEKEWEECLPKADIPELRRMLLVGHGTLCIIDGVDAKAKSGGEIVNFLLRSNLIAWVGFGYLGLKELNAWHNVGEIDAKKVDEYIEKELKEMIAGKR